MQTDPYEKNDLSGDPSLKDKKEELLDQVLNWMSSTNDPFLAPENLEKEIDRLKSEIEP